jgi:hypothetical protein
MSGVQNVTGQWQESLIRSATEPPDFFLAADLVKLRLGDEFESGPAQKADRIQTKCPCMLTTADAPWDDALSAASI